MNSNQFTFAPSVINSVAPLPVAFVDKSKYLDKHKIRQDRTYIVHCYNDTYLGLYEIDTVVADTHKSFAINGIELQKMQISEIGYHRTKDALIFNGFETHSFMVVPFAVVTAGPRKGSDLVKDGLGYKKSTVNVDRVYDSIVNSILTAISLNTASSNLPEESPRWININANVHLILPMGWSNNDTDDLYKHLKLIEDDKFKFSKEFDLVHGINTLTGSLYFNIDVGTN